MKTLKNGPREKKKILKKKKKPGLCVKGPLNINSGLQSGPRPTFLETIQVNVKSCVEKHFISFKSQMENENASLCQNSLDSPGNSKMVS